ncbi:thiamine phosphate synthase [uncultured Rikenella sp.]|uniref:thiamine phosphate synthase n=1 Tax=uncultured Rikenella sp. TaxID=368003 RepID=UPI002614B638|nr:thiamine phosphate synthase [uncultured Rikenella sp.]
MDNFGLYVILTRPAVGHVAAAEIAVRRGVRMLQLREKNLPDGELLRIAREVRAVTRGTQTRFLVDDRPDIAVLCGADGVHVGQSDLPVAEVRRIVGEGMIVGLSTHSVAQATAAQSAKGVDYIGFGPVYPTPTKAVPDPVVGTALLKEVLGFSRLPVVAIGGLFPENIGPVIDAGARNPCLVRYFMEPPDPAEVERRIAEIQRMLL